MNTTLKKRRGFIGMESLLALCAVTSLRPLHCVDAAPPKKSVCYIKFDDGEAGVGISDSGATISASKTLGGAKNGKKAAMAKCGTSGTKSPSASGGIYTEHGIGVRSKKSGIDGKAPLAALTLAHAAAMVASQAHFGGARF